MLCFVKPECIFVLRSAKMHIVMVCGHFSLYFYMGRAAYCNCLRPAHVMKEF